MEPVRVGAAEAGPLVAGALAEAFEVGELVVDEDAAGACAAFERGFAEAGGGADYIDGLSVDGEDGVDVVETGCVGTPEACGFEGAGGEEDTLFAVHHVDWVAVEVGAELAVAVDDEDGEGDGGAIGGGVADLGLDGDVGGGGGDVEVRGVDVDALALEAVVERQGLEDGAGDVEPDAAVDAAVVGIEVVGVPLECGAGGALFVGGGVVELDGEDIFFAVEEDGAGDVDAVGGDAVLVETDLLAIEEDVTGLARAFELEEETAAGELGGDAEVFAIPGETFVGAEVAAAVRDDAAEGVDVVEAVRGADCVPLGVVDGRGFGVGDVLTDELPVEVEVVGGARGCRWGVGVSGED